MKTFFTLLLIATTTFTTNAQALIGNGTLKTETREVSNFSGVVSNGPFDVVIIYGDTKAVNMEADENLLPYIETVVGKNTLVIQFKDERSVKTKNKIRVTVSATKLNTIVLNASGTITADGKFTNDGDTDITIAGSGNLDLSFDSFGILSTVINGNGNMKLKGNARELNAAINGSGDIDAYGVTVDQASVAIRGSGNVNITVNKSLSASIAGSGNVNYKGSATDVVEQSSGSGKVNKS